MPDARPLRVAVADDDEGVRTALEQLLGSDRRFDLRGAFADGLALQDCCRSQRLDVAVIDVAMPGGGPELTRAIRVSSPSTVIAVYTAHHDRGTRAAMLGAGAAGVLVKGRTTDLPGAVVELVDRARAAASVAGER